MEKKLNLMEFILKANLIHNNTSGRYATNGDEYYIKELGYWSDYINFKSKLIIEWDEEKYYINGKLRNKDIVRQQEIQNFFPDFSFKRIRERRVKSFLLN